MGPGRGPAPPALPLWPGAHPPTTPAPPLPPPTPIRRISHSRVTLLSAAPLQWRTGSVFWTFCKVLLPFCISRIAQTYDAVDSFKDTVAKFPVYINVVDGVADIHCSCSML